MAHRPSKEDKEELHEAKNEIQNLQAEWSETLEDLTNTKEETKTGDLFASLNYLSFCDHLCHFILLDLKAHDSQLKFLEQLNKKYQDKIDLELIEELTSSLQELRSHKQRKLQSISEEYPELADDTLRQTERVISKFTDAMQREKITPTLKTDINQNLEKELYLQELKDSLESYRESREEYITELERSSLQLLPKDKIPEDFGAEMPEIDPIISQIDTTITSCDSALLIKEIND